ncbi:hypothetical protein AXG93_1748s1210 [Marchantia polymorpha subsp. ruderalis]|uniref:Uncharacterized protein n=1 Tax=Marchantia polymorpha subsp. ruderalis TaxID=1480154 RepID=A0A176VLJ2_MARPO|nr:hypothetical protein AXG93_1748s1210 [Marchantia polymorpha subsp. ruderalis]
MDDSYCEKHYTIESADFNGSPSEDVEYFLRDFEAIAQYNEQLKGLPTSIRKYCLQAGNNSTMEAAISVAKTYEETAKTPREELHGRGTKRSEDADADVDAS